MSSLAHRIEKKYKGSLSEHRANGPKCTDCGSETSRFWKMKVQLKKKKQQEEGSGRRRRRKAGDDLEVDPDAASLQDDNFGDSLAEPEETENTVGIGNLLVCNDCYTGRKTGDTAVVSVLQFEGEEGKKNNNSTNFLQNFLEEESKEDDVKSEASESKLSTADSTTSEKKSQEVRRMSSRQRQQALKKEAISGRSCKTFEPQPPKPAAPKIRSPALGRRSRVFKSPLSPPFKAPKRRATVVTCGTLWHNGERFTVGDIVSVQDAEDKKCYYARLRGLLSDPYCERFATLTWLLPAAQAATDPSFHPETFVSGPLDETLYPLDALDFVTSSCS